MFVLLHEVMGYDGPALWSWSSALSESESQAKQIEKTPSASSLTPGETIPRRFGRYEIDRVAGKGAKGWVVLATDRVLRRQVALKLFRVTGDDEQQRRQKKQYVDEARAAAQLVHPHILQIYEVGLQEGWVYIATEVLPRGDLKTMVHTRGPLGWLDASRLIIQAADGLAFAHEQGMVHRDVKPANLMLTQRGDCKIVDFGLTFRLDGPVESPGAGTPNYQSPQSARGFAGPQNDVWGLAASLWFLLTGRPPFDLSSGKDARQIHETLILQDLRTLNASVPALIVGVIEQALAKNPKMRFQTVAQFGAALRAATEQAVAQAQTLARGEVFVNPELYALADVADRSATRSPNRTAIPTPSHNATSPWFLGLIAVLLIGALASTALFLLMDTGPTARSTSSANENAWADETKPDKPSATLRDGDGQASASGESILPGQAISNEGTE